MNDDIVRASRTEILQRVRGLLLNKVRQWRATDNDMALLVEVESELERRNG